MRVLFGIVVGAFLTVGVAYLYDSHDALSTTAQTNPPRPLVNWDVVHMKWNYLTRRAHAEWARVAD